MQDLGRFTKRQQITIKTRYLSSLSVGAVVVVGLVFALGVLIGSGQNTEARCTQNTDPLAALDAKSKEPGPPEIPKTGFSFHKSLRSTPETTPTPASLFSKDSNSLAKERQFRAATEKSSGIRPALEEDPIPERLQHNESGYYSLQVGSFQSFREANKMVRMLERAGHKTYLVSATMPERGGLWYRVRVGPFLSKKDAWTYKKAFEERERIPTFVVKRRVNG